MIIRLYLSSDLMSCFVEKNGLPDWPCQSFAHTKGKSIVATGAIDFSTSNITPSLKVRAPWFINEDWYSRNFHSISDEVVSEWQEFFTPAIFKGVYMLYKEFLCKFQGFCLFLQM